MTSTIQPDLQRTLKSRQLFTLLFGTIIGAGWIIAVGIWVGTAGPIGALIAFLGGCLVMTLIALCFAELMTMFPDAGGTIAYAREAFGPRAGFAAGWLLINTYVVATAYFMIALIWLLDALSGQIAGPVLYTILGFDVHLGHTLIGLGCAAFLAFINIRGTAVAAGVQDALVLIKILVAVLLIALSLQHGSAEHIVPAFIGSGPADALRGIVIVMVTTPFWFAGFDVLTQAIRERSVGTSLQSLGRIMVLAMLGALLFYFGIILASTSLVDRKVLLAADLPTYTAFAEGLNSPALARFVLIAGICGILTAWNALIFAGARLVQILATEQMLPGFFAPLHSRYSTPARAIVAVTALAVGLALLGRNAVMPLIAASSITLVGVFVIISAGVVRLRRSQPGRARPYKVPGRFMPALAVILSVGIVVLAILEPLGSAVNRFPIEWTIVTVWCLLGVFAWRIARKRALSRRGQTLCTVGNADAQSS